ncbi:unnamed protein product, partial [marine sediment metagenome]
RFLAFNIVCANSIYVKHIPEVAVIVAPGDTGLFANPEPVPARVLLTIYAYCQATD